MSPAGKKTGLKDGNLGALSFTSSRRIESESGGVAMPPALRPIAYWRGKRKIYRFSHSLNSFLNFPATCLLKRCTFRDFLKHSFTKQENSSNYNNSNDQYSLGKHFVVLLSYLPHTMYTQHYRDYMYLTWKVNVDGFGGSRSRLARATSKKPSALTRKAGDVSSML